jgi:hypothetical protein
MTSNLILNKTFLNSKFNPIKIKTMPVKANYKYKKI